MLLKKISKIFNTLETKPVARYATVLLVLLVIAMFAVVAYFAKSGIVSVLEPRGLVGAKERNLFVFTILLSLVVIIPVYFLLFFIAIRYRSSNKKAKYTPDWDGHRGVELLWWAIPLAIITVLSVITWNSSHDLDPFRPLNSNKKPLTIQVVALQWKWLFIYPEQGVATVNYVQLPQGTPINFEITADAPMNSFWLPQLGGQVYAMSGMTTQLHLIADKAGTYKGSSANISGEGFANMAFTAHAVPQAEFDKWVASAKKSPYKLNTHEYMQLAEPSSDVKINTYLLATKNLKDMIVMKYMAPGSPLQADNSKALQLSNEAPQHH